MDRYDHILASLGQLGPGRDEDTSRALKLISEELPETARILDVGCGAGRQTFVLAREHGGTIWALDRSARLLSRLETRAQQQGLSHRIRTMLGTMVNLPFEEQQFDLIWSENAIHIIGFEEGLRAWRHCLKPGGLLVVSDYTWLTDTPPDAAKMFWSEVSPLMSDVSNHLRIIAESGFREVAHFRLGREAWWDQYLLPLKERIEALRMEHGGDPELLATLEEFTEIELFLQHGDSYGCVFYLMRLDTP